MQMLDKELTEMKSKSRIQAHDSLVLHNVLRSLQSAFRLVVGCNGLTKAWFGNARVVSISHEDRHLGAELGQLERALGSG